MTLTVSRTSSPDVDDPVVHRARRVALVAAVPALTVAALRVPLATPGNDTELHRFLPLALAVAGPLLVLVAARTGARSDAGARWRRWLAVAGVLETLHALVLGSLSVVLARHVGGVALDVVAWLEDWFFVVADGALAMVPLAIATRRSRGWDRVVLAGAALLGLGALLNAFTPRDLDTPAGLANPLGIPGLDALAPVGITCFVAVMLLSLVLALVRHGVGAARGAGTAALGAAVVNLVAFVGQASVPQDASTAVSVVLAVLMPLAWLAIALLGARAVTGTGRGRAARSRRPAEAA